MAIATLSANWRQLQARIQAESTQSSLRKRATEGQPFAPAAKIQKITASPNAALTISPAGLKAKKKKMGATHSSTSTVTVKPPLLGLALGNSELSITSEDLEIGYKLGLSPPYTISSTEDVLNRGLTPDFEPGKYVAIDCEMVGVGPRGTNSALARVSIVDFRGRLVYDSFVRPKEQVTNWRTAVSGIKPTDMLVARDFNTAQAEIAELLKTRVLVGHDLRNDFAALQLSHPSADCRDTSQFRGFKKYAYSRRPALRVLSKELLGLEIQKSTHSSIEDARVAMLLFRKCKPEFDAEHAGRYGQASKRSRKKTGGAQIAVKKKKSKKKKKK